MNDTFSVAGKNTIVTGAALGIGFGIAKRFAEAGANVLIVDQLEGPAFAAADRLSKSKGRVVAMAADVAAENSPNAIVAKCVEAFGSVDILVNNAGIFPMKPFLEMETETFDAVWKINLRGLALLSKFAALTMIAQGRGGSIVNIGSIDSLHPSTVGLAAYDASKGAVLMFTKSLALELAPRGIRVNAVLPGGVETEGTSKPPRGSSVSAAQLAAFREQFVKQRVPMGRMGKPDDIARVVQFVASEGGAYMTGASIVVDGGTLLT